MVELEMWIKGLCDWRRGRVFILERMEFWVIEVYYYVNIGEVVC